MSKAARSLVLLACTVVLVSGCRRERCWDYGDGWSDVEIGIGVTDFIYAPVGTEVQPGWDDEGRHYDIALRGYGLSTSNLDVLLEAFVGETRVASSRTQNVEGRCIRWDLVEVYNLRLDVDPQRLPRMEPLPDSELRSPDVDRPATPLFDTGIFNPEPAPEPWDSGLNRWDSGVDVYAGPADLRIEATITSPNNGVSTGQTTWFVSR